MTDSQRLPDSQSRSTDLPTRKFYICCGPITWIVLAADAETAALRFIQNALKDSLISGPKPVDKELRLINVETMNRLAEKLDEKILVSELGFSRSEAGKFATSAVVKCWRNQIAALERMIRSKA